MRLHNRQVKAAFWEDPKLLRLSRDARTLFHGLMHLADDSGCLEDDAFAFKTFLFRSPLDDDMTLDRIQDLTSQLVEADVLIRYESAGKACLYIRNFHKHQSLRSPAPPDVPLPPWVHWEAATEERRSGKYTVQSPYGDPTNYERSPSARAGEPEPEPEEEPSPNPSQEGGVPESDDKDDQVAEFHEHFVTAWKDVYPRGPKLSPKRRKKIRKRLEEFSLDELKRACDNLHADPFARGKNDRGWIADIDYLIKNQENVDKWLNRPNGGNVVALRPRGDPSQEDALPQHYL